MVKKAKSDHDGNGARALDWEAARQRLSVNSARMSGAALAPEALHEIWERRAALLAQTPEVEETGERIDVLIIRLGAELYGLDAQYVFRMQPLAQLTPVPRAPAWLAGVTNIRGRVVSVFDVRCFLELPPADAPAPTNGGARRDLVVVHTPEMEVALLVQEILSVYALPLAHLSEPRETVRGLPRAYVRGVMDAEANVRFNGGAAETIIVLDLRALLADKRIIVHEE